MSSTSRGATQAAEQFYATPAWVVRQLLDNVSIPLTGRWLEPALGDGAIVNAVNDYALGANRPAPLPRWTGVEIRPVKVGKHSPVKEVFGSTDYLQWTAKPGNYDVAITNPPFSLAWEFAQKMLKDVKDGGHVLILQRLNWLGGAERNAWLRLNPPDVYVIPNRIAFIPGGGWAPGRPKSQTDSIEYAWFHWIKGVGARECYKLMRTLPREQRRIE